jgi:hypothetical protein
MNNRGTNMEDTSPFNAQEMVGTVRSKQADSFKLKIEKHTSSCDTGVSMPVVDVVVSNLQEVNRRGGGDTLDWASLALLTREKSGITDPQSLLHEKL